MNFDEVVDVLRQSLGDRLRDPTTWERAARECNHEGIHAKYTYNSHTGSHIS